LIKRVLDEILSAESAGAAEIAAAEEKSRELRQAALRAREEAEDALEKELRTLRESLLSAARAQAKKESDTLLEDGRKRIEAQLRDVRAAAGKAVDFVVKHIVEA
jgi:vacuolar-type H+-ATPase subunit H